jgi:uncharacterized protein
MQKREAGPVAALLLLLAAGCGEAPTGGFLSIGTAGTGGVYYPLGGAIANRLDAADTDRRYTAEVTGGSVENIQRIRNGEMDLGLTVATSAYEAYIGSADFPQPFRELRVVTPLYPNLTHVLVPRGSDVTSIDQLRGGRVSVGAAGSGTEQVARHTLEAYGLTYDDVDERFLSFTESAAALADGAIDAAILSVGYPASAVLEATTTGGARLLAIDAEHAEALRQMFPFYSPDIIPGGVYRGQDDTVPSVSVMNWIVARADLDSTVAARLIALIQNERDELARTAAIAGQIDMRRLGNAPIPLHPAAEAWLTANTGR